MIFPFKVAAVSDIHLSHARNKTPFILNNLRVAFPDTVETAALDLIVIVGDLFDGLISMPDEFTAEIDYWILELLRLCKKHDIVLRVLEGTPSHDWKQSARFQTLNVGAKINADLKYISTLEIEYIERFDANLLYVPDEWDAPQKTLEQVRALMELKSLTEVDFAFFHGQFHFQLPSIVKAPKHDETSYLAIVKYLIFIGHVHVFNHFERIYAQGSFDRLSHGEEAPKGHLRATLNAPDNFEVTFVENKGARKFITIELTTEDLPQSFEQIEDMIIEEDLPEESFIRIACAKGHPLLQNLDYLIRRWPMMTWSKLVKETHDEIQNAVMDSELAEEAAPPITITKDNIEALLMLRLKTKIDDPHLLSLAVKALAEAR